MSIKLIHRDPIEVDEHVRRIYWTSSPPFGIHGVHPTLLVDMDETFIFIDITAHQRERGHCFIGQV